MQTHTQPWQHYWVSVVTVACDMHCCLINIAILKAVVCSCVIINRIPITEPHKLVSARKFAIDCDNDKRFQEF